MFISFCPRALQLYRIGSRAEGQDTKDITIPACAWSIMFSWRGPLSYEAWVLTRTARCSVKSMRYWESWRWEVTLIFRRHKVAAALCIFHCMAEKYLLSLLGAQGSGCKCGRRKKRKASIVEHVGTIFAVRCGKWRCGWNVFKGHYIRLHNPDC